MKGKGSGEIEIEGLVGRKHLFGLGGLGLRFNKVASGVGLGKQG